MFNVTRPIPIVLPNIAHRRLVWVDNGHVRYTAVIEYSDLSEKSGTLIGGARWEAFTYEW